MNARRSLLHLRLLLLAAGCVNLDRPSGLDDLDAGGVDGPALVDRDASHDLAADGTGADPDSPDAASAPDTGPPADAGALANGAVCSQGDQCRSGFCPRSICCAEACNEICQACNLAGSEGRCVPVPAGQDPNSEC